MYIISTDNLAAWECDTLKEGAEALGKYVADEDMCEPSVIEIWLYEENIALGVDVMKEFEAYMLGWIQERREQNRENELHFRRYGYA